MSLLKSCTFTLVSGVARGVAGVAEATPIFQFLFNRFGQKISVKKSYLLQATPISKTYLPEDMTSNFPLNLERNIFVEICLKK